MFFAIYWRNLLAIILLVLVAGFIHQYTNILALVGNTNYYPTFYWLLIATLFISCTAVNRNGLICMLWGKTLALDSAFWRKVNVTISLFFVFLSVLALLIYMTASKDVWALYKLFAQPIMLLVVPAIYIKKLVEAEKKKGGNT